MEVKYQNLGLKEDYLYEILATTFSFKDNDLIPNTSCMGIKIINNTIIIKPYHSTKTYKNLKNNSLICINLVEDIYLYALAALKGPFLSKRDYTFLEKDYDYYSLKSNQKIVKHLRTNQIPYLRESWAIIICRTKKAVEINKEDIFGSVNLTEFTLEILSILKFKDSYKLYNRAENLTLEALILTTRLKIALEKNDNDLINHFQNKIRDVISNIKQFSKNPEVSKSINLIKEFVRNLNLEF